MSRPYAPDSASPAQPAEPLPERYVDRQPQRQTPEDDQASFRDRRSLSRFFDGLFVISLAFTFFFTYQLGWHLVAPLVFALWAVVALLVNISLGKQSSLYRGLQNATWLLGIALCFLLGDLWPWILLPLGVSLILSALYRPARIGNR